LDKGTSGLMVVALTESAYQRLVVQIAERTVSRVYLAVVWGALAAEGGTVDRPVGRSTRDRKLMAVVATGKPALTSFVLRRSWGVATELQLSLHTGRTHQIRVHMSWMGHPVVGDGDYGGRRSALTRLPPVSQAIACELLRVIDRPALHAWRLTFVHPAHGRRMEFEVLPPSDFIALRAALDEAWPQTP
jgi:23S rRNA pseudouridine1911/1915/1917 synthase